MTQDRIRELERAEIHAFADLYRSAGPDVAEGTGLSVTDVEGGTLFVASRLDVLSLNRLVGLGLNAPVSDDQLGRLVERLARSGAVRGFVPVAPVDGHENLGLALEARGLRHYNNWVRLSRSLVALPEPAATTLTVREIDTSFAPTFGRIVATAFGYPPALAPIASVTVGRPGWRHYMAFHDETPVAAAAMYVHGTAAWFGLAATDTQHRKQGAQHALVVRRLHDAAAAGCALVSVETAEDSIVKDAPSFRNLRRLGFEVAYVRPNHLWTAAGLALA